VAEAARFADLPLGTRVANGANLPQQETR
jgi:hypothetical protein